MGSNKWEIYVPKILFPYVFLSGEISTYLYIISMYVVIILEVYICTLGNELTLFSLFKNRVNSGA